MNNRIDAAWRKSSRSGQDGQCVELARLTDGVAVRDSKNPDGPVLRFGRAEMRRAMERIRNA